MTPPVRLLLASARRDPAWIAWRLTRLAAGCVARAVRGDAWDRAAGRLFALVRAVQAMGRRA